MNVAELLREIAKNTPNSIGFRCPHRNFFSNTLHYRDVTFGEIDHIVDLFATYFLSKGLSKNKKILLFLPNGEDLILAVFALLRTEAIPIIIDPGMGIKNFISCVKKTKPEFFLGCQKTRFIFYILKLFFNFKGSVFLTKSFKIKLLKQNFACQLQPIKDLSQTAAILFTSGSTGHPKGAVYTHNEFNAQIDTLIKIFNIKQNEIDLPLLPVFSLYNLAIGITTVFPEIDSAHPSKLNPQKIIEAIQTCNVTHSFGSPRLWYTLVDYCENNGIVLDSIKRLFIAGAPVNPNLLTKAQNILPNDSNVYIPYGATECLPIACISAKEVSSKKTNLRTFQGNGTCVGKVLVNIKIIPISDGVITIMPNELPSNTIGEIVVCAKYMSKCYLNDDDANKNNKITDTSGVIWHRIGDVGYLDDDGYLWFCGRKIERVVTKYKTFYTDCCEAIFNANRSIFRSALISYKINDEIQPAIIIDPKYHLRYKDQQRLFEELKKIANDYDHTKLIKYFGVYENFPVDVRHNAKIHRLKLMKYFNVHKKKIFKL